MAASVLVDAGFLVALLNRRDGHHPWATAEGPRYPPPWHTCEAALSEAFHLLGNNGGASLAGLLRRDAVRCTFRLNENIEPVLRLMGKYVSVPMDLADACLVRMTEIFPDPILITTDRDFAIYRRHSRQVVPCIVPG